MPSNSGALALNTKKNVGAPFLASFARSGDWKTLGIKNRGTRKNVGAPLFAFFANGGRLARPGDFSA
jgi:hypothetical protein